MRYDDLGVGMRAAFSRRITAEDIAAFATLSGDENPLHMDADYAAGTPLGGRIAHGMLSGALLSRLVGMHLPGRYALYLSQSMDFVRPVRIGDTLEVSGELLSKQDATRTVVLKTEVRAAGELVLRGRAVVKVLE